MERNVLITGSASGLGYEAVRVFAERLRSKLATSLMSSRNHSRYSARRN